MGSPLAGHLVLTELVGDCNQCGLCCADTDGFRCENLELVGSLGTPQATRCKVYDTRYDGMPIVMRRYKTGQSRPAQCWKDSWNETLAITLKGLDKGCSLVRKE